MLPDDVAKPSLAQPRRVPPVNERSREPVELLRRQRGRPHVVGEPHLRDAELALHESVVEITHRPRILAPMSFYATAPARRVTTLTSTATTSKVVNTKVVAESDRLTTPV
jgi:hypothetical protein